MAILCVCVCVNGLCACVCVCVAVGPYFCLLACCCPEHDGGVWQGGSLTRLGCDPDKRHVCAFDS